MNGRERRGEESPPWVLRSSRLKVDGLPVVDVVAASSTTGRLDKGLRLRASSMPLTTWSMETLRPLRGRKPWLARELSMGHGLRPTGDISSFHERPDLRWFDLRSCRPGAFHGWLSTAPQLPPTASAVKARRVLICMASADGLRTGEDEGKARHRENDPR